MKFSQRKAPTGFANVGWIAEYILSTSKADKSSARTSLNSGLVSSEGALYVILPYDYQAAAAAATF